MVKRLIAVAGAAAIAAVLWVLVSNATSGEAAEEISVEACLSDGFVDCVSFETPVLQPPALVMPCKAWLTADASPALLSRCLDVMRDARGEAAQRRRAIATSS